FGLNRNEPLEAYGTSKELVDRFVQAVANGGGMILNVGPKADGQIPLIQQERLLQLGDWLAINGNAIYGSRPYDIVEEEKMVSKQRVDSVINFNWVRNSPMKGIKEDDFTAEWKGYLVAPVSGTYTFEVKADDAASVTIDNTLVIDQNYTAGGADSQVMGANTGTSTDGKIKLKEGVAYPILIKFKEKKQQAEIALFWSSKKMPKELVPASQLFQDNAATQPGLMGTYSSLKTYLCYTQNQGNIYAIALEWPGDKLELNIPDPGKVTVSMLGLDKVLKYSYSDGKMIIDTSDIGFNELPSYDAWTFEIKPLN
ncbi:MAG: PA14 domain-containing protein, partial [Allomuricauda sp.]